METMQSELKLAHDQMTTMWEELGRQQVTNPLVSSCYAVVSSRNITKYRLNRNGLVSKCIISIATYV